MAGEYQMIVVKNKKNKKTAMEGEYQMIVVCGKNEVVQKGLKSREWPTNVNVVVNGFVSDYRMCSLTIECVLLL